MTTSTRPGVPEGRWWHPFAYLGALFGVAVLAWALLGGAVWLVWAYALVGLAVVAATAVAALTVSLALKHDRRAKLAAIVLFAALVALVGWVINQ